MPSRKAPGQTRTKYPWDEWTDGSWRELEIGKDFTVALEDLPRLNALGGEAKEHDVLSGSGQGHAGRLTLKFAKVAPNNTVQVIEPSANGSE